MYACVCLSWHDHQPGTMSVYTAPTYGDAVQLAWHRAVQFGWGESAADAFVREIHEHGAGDLRDPRFNRVTVWIERVRSIQIAERPRSFMRPDEYEHPD